MAGSLKRKKGEILGTVSVLFAAYLAISLSTHSKWDPSFFTYAEAPVRNYGGVAGAYVSDLLISLLGFSSYLFPLFLTVYGVKRLLMKKGHGMHLAGALLIVPSISLSLELGGLTFGFGLESPGGYVGRVLSEVLVGLFSVPGAYIFALSALLTSAILLSPVSLVSLVLRERKEGGKSLKEAGEGKVLDEHYDIKFTPAPMKDFEEAPAPAPRAEEPVGIPPPPRGGAYKLPPIELLKGHGPSASRPSKEELISASSMLERKLRDFSVEGKVTHVHAGPIVTMYEYEPAPGVKINRVVSLSEDIALALKAQGVRISPIQGKSALGIEVPNRQYETVSLREALSSEGFRKSPSFLTIALGKDIFGGPVTADLVKMPHLLVAGATGAGKSVSLNSMVISVLFKAGPDEVRMLMIDPKLLELSYYEGIPHLISPVITSPKEASEALRKMVFEMERRYRVIAERGARSIEGFNMSVPEEEKMPYIVIFIDELADLMFTAPKEVEDCIARLAQMARAAGIHLVLATQRPSVDVITGVIKANFPARIAFQVTSKIDSRTILDAVGAEQLMGKGDMLMMMPGVRLRRVHGAFVSEEEIRSVTAFIRAQGGPDYSMFESMGAASGPDDEEHDRRDDLYRKAVEFADYAGEVSISSLQRRLKIGYNRAAKIMEMMEEDGLVGPPKAAGKPRDFLRRPRI